MRKPPDPQASTTVLAPESELTGTSNLLYLTEEEIDEIALVDKNGNEPTQRPQQVLQTQYGVNHMQGLEEQFLGNLKGLFSQWSKKTSTGSQIGSGKNINQTWISLKDRIVNAAENEWVKWDKGHRHETNPRFQTTLRQYYLATGITADRSKRFAKSNLNRDHKKRNPWSAAFISYIMQSAAAGKYFRYSTAHYTYISWAKKNREQKALNPFWLYDLQERKPEPGDLICNYRGCAEMTYANIDRIKSDPCHQVKKNAWWSHCDIVVKVMPLVRKVYVIGGNTGNNKHEFGGLGASTVGKKWRRLDANGYLVRENRVFAVIGIRGKINTPIINSRSGSTQSNSRPLPMGSKVPARIQQYDSLIQTASRKHSVDPAIIRAIIAAESGGDPDRTSVANYKGLMQSGKTNDHYQPEISIDHGTSKFSKMRSWIISSTKKRSGIDLGNIKTKELAKIVLAGYNAGHVTPIKAIEYAVESGNWQDWHDPQHYQRALVFSGGYHRYKQCMKSVSSAQITLANIARRKYSGWKKKHGGQGNWRSFQDPPHLDQIQLIAPKTMLCWVSTKHRNTFPYLRKFQKYL